MLVTIKYPMKILLNKSLLFIFLLFLSAQTLADPKVTQASLINFKSNDVVALAVEEIGKPAKLLFVKTLGEKSIVYSEEFGEYSIPVEDEEGGYMFINPFLRFRAFYIDGFPQPIIMAIAVMPSGTDVNYDIKILSEKNGFISLLNPERLDLSSQEGIFIGHINSKYGDGLITWRFKWDAAHYDPHRYEIHIYRWNKNEMTFNLMKKFVTKSKFKNGCSALLANKLPCKNFRSEVVNEGDVNTMAIENEYLGKNNNK